MGVILGINMSGRDSSAAVVVDGAVHFAIREERLNLEKKTRRFPTLSIQACLDAVGRRLEGVDRVGISWNPTLNLERLNSAQSGLARYKPEHFYAVPNHLLQLWPRETSSLAEQRLHFPSGVLEIVYVNHHICHAADSFLQSPFEEAAILILDAYGEKDSVTFARGSGTRIEVLRTIPFPHSLGSFYGTMTQFLGFTPDLDEWKLMGASAYGDPARYYAAVRQMFFLREDGGFELDLSYFNYPTFSRPTMYSDKLVALLGPPRHREQDLEQRHYDIAAATQRVTEEVVFHLLHHLHVLVGGENLCLGGGVAMNCVLNGKVAEHTPFRHVWIGSSPDDGGTSVGAALYLAAQEPGFRREPTADNYWGPGYEPLQIEAELRRYGLAYRLSAQPAREAAALIASGRIVGWFQGRMEFGERALGNRSILADPRDATMKDRVNRAIKYREAFRPFAPSILEEHAAEFFEGAHAVPFMEKALMIRKDRQPLIPAVTHADGTGRLQTVRREVNPAFWALIREFHALAGVPLVLNTSFNLQGEPIVCSPKDAIRTFFSSGLDALFLGPFVLFKPTLSEPRANHPVTTSADRPPVLQPDGA
jgi:carbamoyltransferase